MDKNISALAAAEAVACLDAVNELVAADPSLMKQALNAIHGIGGNQFLTIFGALRAVLAEKAAGAAPAGPEPFNVNLCYDGNGLSVDYCDGSDVQYDLATDRLQLTRLVREAIAEAMSRGANERE